MLLPRFSAIAKACENSCCSMLPKSCSASKSYSAIEAGEGVCGGDRFRGKLARNGEVELVHLDVLGGGVAVVSDSLRNREDDKEEDGEQPAGYGGLRFGEEVDDRDTQEDQGNQAQSDGDFHAKNAEV